MLRSWLLIILVAVLTTGCLDRTRVNWECQWDPERDPDGVRSLNLGQWPDQLHLYKDVELAEDLAIRYADRIHDERFGSYGHGGLIENGGLRNRCMASLVREIAAAHGLAVDQVEQARAQGYRDWRWDYAVLMSFGGLFGVIAWAFIGRVFVRFPADEGWFALCALFASSFPAGVAAVQLSALWGGALEAFRVGNGHMSSWRVAESPWAAHRPAFLIGGVIGFLLLAGFRYWLHRRDHRHQHAV